MYQPKPKWVEQDNSSFLLWGHVRVGEVTKGGYGWYACYRDDINRFRSLKDFPAHDLAQRAVELAVEEAANESCYRT